MSDESGSCRGASTLVRTILLSRMVLLIISSHLWANIHIHRQGSVQAVFHVTWQRKASTLTLLKGRILTKIVPSMYHLLAYTVVWNVLSTKMSELNLIVCHLIKHLYNFKHLLTCTDESHLRSLAFYIWTCFALRRDYVEL